MKSPFELSVASLLLYPKGDGGATRRARSFIRYEIKMARHGVISRTVKRLLTESTEAPLLGFLGKDCSLVPVPGHVPRVKGGLWVARIICQEMVACGFGVEVLPCLTRTESVARSSSRACAQDRPAVADHYRTFQVENILPATGRVLLVDDVVTRGATLVGAALRLGERFPSIPIEAFALARAHPAELVDTREMLKAAVESITFDAGPPERIKRA